MPNPLRILVVDDNERLQGILARHLTRAGHDVITAGDGRAGLSLASTGRFDAVLTDLFMPECDGISMSIALRKAGVSTPIIVMTAHLTTDGILQALRAGVCDVLAKPFPLEDVDSVLARVTSAPPSDSVLSASAFSSVQGSVQGFVKNLDVDTAGNSQVYGNSRSPLLGAAVEAIAGALGLRSSETRRLRWAALFADVDDKTLSQLQSIGEAARAARRAGASRTGEEPLSLSDRCLDAARALAESCGDAAARGRPSEAKSIFAARAKARRVDSVVADVCMKLPDQVFDGLTSKIGASVAMSSPAVHDESVTPAAAPKAAAPHAAGPVSDRRPDSAPGRLSSGPRSPVIPRPTGPAL